MSQVLITKVSSTVFTLTVKTPSKSNATVCMAAMAGKGLGKGLGKTQLLLDQFAEDMADEDVSFLDSSGGV